jgi:hypothetical protein
MNMFSLMFAHKRTPIERSARPRGKASARLKVRLRDVV